MKRTIIMLAAAGAVAITPTMAAPPGGGGGGGASAMHGPSSTMTTGPSATPNGPHTPSPTTAPGNGQFNGQGYNHMHTQAQAKGQPNQSCEELGTTPGNSASAPGGGSPFSGEDSTSGTHYAGSQLQNSRNSASVSQYDVACANQPH
jgi:hypothetical protein